MSEKAIKWQNINHKKHEWKKKRYILKHYKYKIECEIQ